MSVARKCYKFCEIFKFELKLLAVMISKDEKVRGREWKCFNSEMYVQLQAQFKT
jgi:hypothetical protein